MHICIFTNNTLTHSNDYTHIYFYTFTHIDTLENTHGHTQAVDIKTLVLRKAEQCIEAATRTPTPSTSPSPSPALTNNGSEGVGEGMAREREVMELRLRCEQLTQQVPPL
jgi:hypothetical protein